MLLWLFEVKISKELTGKGHFEGLKLDEVDGLMLLPNTRTRPPMVQIEPFSWAERVV